MLDTNLWKEFKISDIFEIKKGKRHIEEDRVKGNVKYFSASEFNNGLTDMIENPLFIEKDALIYSTFGDCYYVKGNFTASDEISILINKKLNEKSGLFIATVLQQNKYKYAYGRKAFKNKFENEIIKLPTVNDKPDWNFMEKYIEKLEKLEKIRIKNLLENLR